MGCEVKLIKEYLDVENESIMLCILKIKLGKSKKIVIIVLQGLHLFQG